MKTTDFNTKPTTQQLCESYAKMYGSRPNPQQFSIAELRDMISDNTQRINEIASKLRYNEHLQNRTYQQEVNLRQIFETELATRLTQQPTLSEVPVVNKAVDAVKGMINKMAPQKSGGAEFAALQKLAGPKAPMAKRALDYIEQGKAISGAQSDAVKPFIKLLRAFTQKGVAGMARLDMAKKAMGEVREVRESVITEGEMEKAELALAGKDIVDTVTGQLEDLSDINASKLLELSDRIRDEMGSDVADAFVAKVQPAIQSAIDALSASREELDSASRMLTGEEQPEADTMGADDDLADLDDAETDIEATDAEAGGEDEPLGRAKRESIEVFESSNRIYSTLSKRK
jgi:hypothetical protein